MVNIFSTKSLVFICSMTCLLAESVTAGTKRTDAKLSAEICEQLRRSQSRLFFHVFCTGHDAGSRPQPPTDATALKKISKFSSEICDRLCNEGNGGAVCDCSSGLPPAVVPPKPSKPEVATNLRPKSVRTRSKVVPRMPVPPS
jgi:hypothetical protein